MEDRISEQTFPIQELSALLWRRRKLIGLAFAIGLVTVVVVAWTQAPLYRASGKLMVTSARATMTVSPDANERPRVDPVTEADLAAEVAMLRSRTLLRDVLAPYHERSAPPPPSGWGRVGELIHYPYTIPGRIYRSIHDLPPDSGLDLWTDEAEPRLAVTPVGHSSLIDVSFEDRNPSWAAELVNSLIASHVERHVQINQQASAQQFYESQRAVLTDKLRDAEVALHAFYEREGIGATGTRLTALRDRVAQLETSLADAETELAESTAEAEYLARAVTEMPRTNASAAGTVMTTSGLINNRIVELELQRSQLLSQFAPSSIKITDLNRQIATARKLLEREKAGTADTADPARQSLETTRTQTQARAAALQARTASLREQVASSRAQLVHLDAIASEQERLEQEASVAKQSFATYVKKEEEARFSNAMDESRIVNVTVVEKATVPQAPLASKRAVTIAFGAMVSLVAALALGFLRDWLDPSVKSAAEARRISRLPVLAEVPS